MYSVWASTESKARYITMTTITPVSARKWTFYDVQNMIEVVVLCNSQGSGGRDRVGVGSYCILFTVLLCRLVVNISTQLISSTISCHYSEIVICLISMALPLWGEEVGYWQMFPHGFDYYPELTVGGFLDC